MPDSDMPINRFIRQKEFVDYFNSSSLEQNTVLKSLQNKEKTKFYSQDYSVEFSPDTRNYCVGFVDVVNSTRISAGLPVDKLSQYYEIFLNSVSRIIEKFGGKVIKNVGDCLLYYFPNYVPFAEAVFENCLDCGLAMLKAQSIISQQMMTKKLPNLSYRISADFGNVIPMNTSVSTTFDLIGQPVNTSAKINRCAGSNELVIGSNLYQFVKKFSDYKFTEIKKCDVGLSHPYSVYKVILSR